jgi:hypothetical protein
MSNSCIVDQSFGYRPNYFRIVKIFFLLLLFLTFMRGTYNYVPEKKNVSSSYCVAVIPQLQSMVM